MAAQQHLSLNVPEDLYERLRQVAERSDRSVEAVALESLALMFGTQADEVALAAMDDYDDSQLWAVVYQRMAWPQRERLRELTAKGELTEAEETELAALVDHMNYFMLLRSKALWLLKRRGHDVDRLVKLGA